MAAATIPIAGIASSNAWTAYKNALAAGPRDAMMLRQAAAARHGAAMDTMKEMLAGIERSGNLTSLDTEACSAKLARLRDVFVGRYSNIWMMDQQGRFVCSGIPGPIGADFSELAYFRALRGGQDYAVGEFSIGRVTGRAVLPAAIAVRNADGSLRAAIATGLYLDVFFRTEREPRFSRPHQTWLLDKEGTALPLGEASIESLPPIERLQALSREQDATIEGDARNGDAYVWSLEQLEPGLRLLIGLPVEQTRAAARAALSQRLIELAIFLLACVVAILVGVELGVARPLRRLAARVRAWAPGRALPPGGENKGPREVRDLDHALSSAAIALQEREVALTSALHQRDLLMAEIHHRVKNNLQIVASLLNLQADRLRSPTARTEFAVARDRVQALATLHRHLYLHQTFERIALRPFLEELSRQLGDALGCGPEDGVSIAIEAEDIEIASDQAISLALLVTEAVSNAMRHAFPDDREGTITVSLKTDGSEARLVIADDGVGIEPGGNDGDSDGDGLGLRLIRGFATHLGGEAEISSGQGTRIAVTFPLHRRSVEETLRGAA